jgi:hypothetical protein
MCSFSRYKNTEFPAVPVVACARGSCGTVDPSSIDSVDGCARLTLLALAAEMLCACCLLMHGWTVCDGGRNAYGGAVTILLIAFLYALE